MPHPNSNPLFLDPRTGSTDLHPILASIGVDVQVSELPCADMAWMGNGPDGPTFCGVERKNLGDFVASMRERRLQNVQIPALISTYTVRWIVLEGIWRVGESAELPVEIMSFGWRRGEGAGARWKQFAPGKRKVSAGELIGFLAAVEGQAEIGIIRTNSAWETAVWVKQYWHWWQKEWGEHQSLGLGGVGGVHRVSKVSRVQSGVKSATPNMAWIYAAEVPGIGLKMGKRMGEVFGKSARRMVNASVEELAEVELNGRKLGRKRAEYAWKLWGGTDTGDV